MKKISVVGIGPGNKEYMSYRAVNAIKESDTVVGYTTYMTLVEEFLEGKEVFSTGMKKEIDRCQEAINIANTGKNVSVVCSGDPGVYAMAGLIYELLEKDELLKEIEVEVVPGITSATACASILGAPLMHDFCLISMSDYLTPLDLIMKRIEFAIRSDFVIVLYNPRSKARPDYLEQAFNICLEYASPDTPVGIVTSAYREKQSKIITTLGDIDFNDVGMFSTVIIGNSKSKVVDGLMITPRGYSI